MAKREHIFDNIEEANDYIIVAIYSMLVRLKVDTNDENNVRTIDTAIDNIKCYSNELAYLMRDGKFDGYKPEAEDLDALREEVLKQTAFLKAMMDHGDGDDEEEEQ